MCSSEQLEQRLQVVAERRPASSDGPPGPRVAVDDRELDLASRPRRGRGTARRPRPRPRRCARRDGRPCSRRGSRAAAPRAPCAARSASAAAAPRSRRRAAARRRPSSGPRSTSPPKSAWPGRVDDVDLRLAVADRGVLGEDRDALLALEVHRVHHPLGDVLVRRGTTPDCQSIASTSVVLPWSTWATIATFRMSSRSATEPG